MMNRRANRLREALLGSTLIGLLVAAMLPATVSCMGNPPDIPPGSKWPPGQTGTARVTIAWSQVSSASVREIPNSTESISLQLFHASTGREITGLPGLDQFPINRPSGAPPWPDQTVEISDVPATDIRFEAAAWS